MLISFYAYSHSNNYANNGDCIFNYIKHISGVDDELDAANANTDEFLDEYYDWLDSHPNY